MELISRQDAIDAVSKLYRYESDRITALQEVPIYNFGWIAVEERLPDESDCYCVTTEDIDTGIRIEQTIWFAHKDDYYIEESEWRELADHEKVIAWRKSNPYNPKSKRLTVKTGKGIRMDNKTLEKESIYTSYVIVADRDSVRKYVSRSFPRPFQYTIKISKARKFNTEKQAQDYINSFNGCGKHLINPEVKRIVRKFVLID